MARDTAARRVPSFDNPPVLHQRLGMGQYLKPQYAVQLCQLSKYYATRDNITGI